MRWKLNDVMVVLDLVQPCDSNQLRDAQHRGKNRGPDSLTQFPHRAAGEEATPHFVSQPTVISVIITTRRAGYRTKGRRHFHTTLWERLVLIVSPKSSAVLTIDFFGLWEFVR